MRGTTFAGRSVETTNVFGKGGVYLDFDMSWAHYQRLGLGWLAEELGKEI